MEGRGERLEVVPRGAIPLASLSLEGSLGDEARDLGALARGQVPLARGWVVRLSGEPQSCIAETVERALGEAPCARLRPLFPSAAAAVRFDRRAGTLADVRRPDETAARAREILALLRDLKSGGLGGIHLRVIACDPEPAGRAASADPVDGDPEHLRVWTFGAPPGRYRFHRRTMRLVEEAEGQLDTDAAARVADLADRAQLVLGRPVEIEWCTRGGRPGVVSVRPIPLRPTFLREPYRRVALLAADEGTVAPLTIDALDRALGRDDAGGDEPRVRRIYARPYRRADRSGDSLGPPDPLGIALATTRAARVAATVASPVRAAMAFERSIRARLAALDTVDLAGLDDGALLAALRAREELLAEAYLLLDRGRAATLAVLAALEATVGPLPRECFPALSEPRPARARRRVNERLQKLARRMADEVGVIAPRDRLPDKLGRRFDELKGQLALVRPLGIDVTPDAFGATDASLTAALRDALERDDDAAERARRDAVRRLRATARSRPLGRARESIAASLALLLGRVATSKGSVAEALAAAALRFRSAATEAGRRLVDRGVLEEPDDAMYLYRNEIEEALGGEPGAYAARVRFRREDDLRWRALLPPRRIG